MPRYKPEIWLDLSDVLSEMQVHTVSLGYDGNVYLLASTTHISRYDDWRPLVRTEKPIDYVALVIDRDKQISRHHIKSQTLIYSYLQPLPNRELLVASGRARFHKKSDYDLNGQVFTRDGVLQREFLLGDGIGHLQTTSKGMIWTAYFDEGILGNFGWGNQSKEQKPIGAKGLLQWDSSGNIQWEFDADKLKEERIADCYALNVVDDDTVWFYYYGAFRLICLKNGRIYQRWRCPTKGIKPIAVGQNHIMFYSRYRYTLYGFEAGRPMRKVSDHKVSPRPECLDTRGDTFVFLNDMRLYRMTINDIIDP